MTEQINFHCWEGYEHESFLQPFQRQAGVRVNAQTLLSDAEAAEQIVTGNAEQCHVLNINNGWVRDYLCPRGHIKTLDEERFGHAMRGLLSCFGDDLGRWAYDDNNNLTGVCQRFGPFNLVANTRMIDKDSAEDQGFSLALDKRYHGRFGVLTYIDFNLFHLCIGADIDPFTKLTAEQLVRVASLADHWQRHASIISDDHFVLNKALVNGDIDFYLSGGVYTAAIARRDGHNQIRAVTPVRGPIDGKGGIVFAEITSIIDQPETPSAAEQLLEWLIRPDTSAAAAMTERTCNPVAQMGNPAVLQRFSNDQLRWIQWDDLAQSVARSAPYALMPSHAEVLSIWQAALRSHRQS